jgi:uncharacterized membrane protein YobD (UPF0266 family)
MYMNAQKRVCTLGVHVHIHVMYIYIVYRRQSVLVPHIHGIWNANIFISLRYREGTVQVLLLLHALWCHTNV